MIIDQHIIYIPLCFYFITKLLVGNSASLTLFTFHYASTLSNVLCTSIALISAFTFHYASTLSYLLFCRSHCLGFIYIPLCFYFIDELNRFRTLLNLIYIPLCFYFISLSVACPVLFSTIYIPLCFYFILRLIHHYTVYFPFTFHYASTLSAVVGSNAENAIYLHSTMLLLYLVTVSSGSDLFLIYIPLCFYFIAHVHGDNPPSMSFTFHYASTLSARNCSSCRRCHYLHSTMLLLYLGSDYPVWGYQE